MQSFRIIKANSGFTTIHKLFFALEVYVIALLGAIKYKPLGMSVCLPIEFLFHYYSLNWAHHRQAEYFFAIFFLPLKIILATIFV